MIRSAENPLKVLIADDHAIFRDGLKLLLQKLSDHHITCIGEACNGKESLQLASQLAPQVLLIDIQMPIMDGIEATRQIKAKFSHIEVIALTMFNEEHLVVDMLEAGASGYLLKNTSRDELLQAVLTVVDGGVYFTPAASVHLANTILHHKAPPREPQVKITDREKEIIFYLCKGNSTKEIAQQLHLSPRTIESHRENLYLKTSSRSAIELVIYAIRHKLVSIEEL